MTPGSLAPFRRKLLAWFDASKRPMPWRADRDPYRIWVSEVMLQQTQVAAVIPYFNRFMDRFPDVRSLAESDEQEVLKLWQGLGYYRRARDLRRAAQMIVAEHSGALANDPEVWDSLPGVGKYIRNAVLSQAFERPLPVVEANTKRLYTRLFGYTGDPASKEGQAWLWETGERLLPRKRVGDFNQAVMELGALVCLPTPRCDACPVAKLCTAHEQGLQETIPLRPARKVFEDVRSVALVLRHKGKYLLVRRPADGRWANLWEFPSMELKPGETDEAVLDRILAGLGVEAEIGERIAVIKHGVTRFKIAMGCYESRPKGRPADPADREFRWLAVGDFADYPLSSPMRELHRILEKPRTASLFK